MIRTTAKLSVSAPGEDSEGADGNESFTIVTFLFNLNTFRILGLALLNLVFVQVPTALELC